MNDTTNLPPLPEPLFCSWHSEEDKTLLNPTGVCNAFPWPPRRPEDKYWVDKGYHAEPLYTADQLRAAILAERERCADLVLRELGDTGQAQAIAAAIREGDK